MRRRTAIIPTLPFTALAINDALEGRLKNSCRLNRDAVLYLNWRRAGVLPAASFYQMDSRDALAIFALHRAIEQSESDRGGE